MPLEEVNINKCLGVAGATDARDVGPEHAYYAENLDTTNRYGALIGLPEDDPWDMTTNTVDSTGDIAMPFGVDGDVCIVDSSASEINIQNYNSVTDPPIASKATGSPFGSITFSGNYHSVSAESYAVRVGCGNSGSSPAKFVGRAYYTQDSHTDLTSGSWIVENAHLSNDFIGVNTNSTQGTAIGTLKIVMPLYGSTSPVDTNTSAGCSMSNAFHKSLTMDREDTNIPFGLHRWYASAIYDNNQESPLVEILHVDIFKHNLYAYDTESSGGYGFFKDSNNIWTNATYDGTQTLVYYRRSNSTTGLPEEISLGTSGGAAWWDWHFASGQQNYVGLANSRCTFSGNLPFDLTILQDSYNYRYFMRSYDDLMKGVHAVDFRLLIRSRNLTPTGATLPKRVTGIKLYRRTKEILGYNPDNTAQLGDTGYMFIKYFSLLDGSSDVDGTVNGSTTEGWAKTNEQYLYIDVRDDVKTSTVDYYGETFIEPELTTTRVDYGLSTMVGGYNIVGRCYAEKLTSIETWIFRSKPWRLDIFDWTKDFLMLPAVPLAMKTFNGRVYAFCQNATYVIDPYAMEIIETWTGIGGLHGNAIVVTERGMFWGDMSSIYHHDGVRLWDIGAPIKHLHDVRSGGSAPHDVGWLSKTYSTSAPTTDIPSATYVGSHGSFFMTYGVDSATDVYVGLLYHLETRTWMLVTDIGGQTAAPVEHMHVTTEGRVLVSVGGDMYTLFGEVPLNSTSDPATKNPRRRKWVWASRNLHEGTGKGKYYKARLHMMTLPSDEDASVISFDNSNASYMPTVEWTYATSYATAADGLNASTVESLDLDSTSDDTVASYLVYSSAPEYVRNFGVVVTDSDTTQLQVHPLPDITYNNVVGHVSLIRRMITPR